MVFDNLDHVRAILQVAVDDGHLFMLAHGRGNDMLEIEREFLACEVTTRV